MRECSPIDVLSDVLDDVPDLAFAFAEDGSYLYVNRAAAAFLGTDPADVIGYHWRELGYAPEVLEPLLQRAEDVMVTGTAQTWRTKSTAQRGGRMLDISLSPLRCDEDRICAVLVIAHDISEFFATES